VSDLLRIDSYIFGSHAGRLVWRETVAPHGPMPEDPKYAHWLEKASHVLQHCWFLDPNSVRPPASLAGLAPKTPPAKGKMWVWLLWRRGRLPRRQTTGEKLWFDISFRHPSWDWVDTVEAEVMTRSAILAQVSEDTVRLLSEGCPSKKAVEDCLASDSRLSAAPATQRESESPSGEGFEFRMDVCIDWITQRRDDGILNLWYHQNMPMEHRIGQVISPMMAILAIPGLSSLCVETLNDV
jgi:hypothetical protein